MAKKMAIPWKFKYEFTMGGWTSNLKAYLYAIREKYGAEAALEIYERVNEMDDRIKNMTNTLKEVFKLEGNNGETFAQWWEVFWEITEMEYIIPERSKTFTRFEVLKCPWTTEPKDISVWCFLSLVGKIAKTINPQATLERPKAMCAGDPHCEYIFKLEE
ncbi:methanogen output domain 1-containing protein [Candidatus Borrarchaeum sp.]|uniref:methanogen output domain 1-containing protein n=1 Tax=Candidatus Borrarchaeum sp. TaxID=2846742 RepID=UPI00257FB0C1|nr:methanogen output domain 1-containing protein [Candidatus Borrarchaeum sp.]